MVHSGYDHSPQGQKKKLERDLRLLHQELKEQPQHPFTLFNLGMTYADIEQFPQAVDYLRRSIAVSGEQDSQLRKAYALLSHSYAQMGDREQAWETCEKGLRIFPRDAELLFRKAALLHESGRLREAVQAYQMLLGTDDERHFSSVVRGLKGYLTRHNLALVYTDLKDFAEAETQWRLVTAELPNYAPAWQGLADLLIRQGKHQEAEELANRLRGNKGLEVHGVMVKADVAAARGLSDQARELLERAVEDHPQAPEPLQALCRILFEYGTPAEAEERLRELVRRDPKDAAAYHNLGTLYMGRARFEDAVRAYRESLVNRPRAHLTHLHLGYALEASGCLDEAVTAWEHVLRLCPGNAAATDALGRVQPVTSAT